MDGIFFYDGNRIRALLEIEGVETLHFQEKADCLAEFFLVVDDEDCFSHE